jgi:chemotaxis protein CheY-P-specific phosphatase CheC
VSTPEDKYSELTSICAGNAAGALATLLGTTLHMGPPRCWALRDGLLPAELFAPDERVTAVLAELEGALVGPAGLILRREMLQWVLARLIGDPDVKTLSERALSAICEVGNIAVSAAANALSEMVGGVVVPSVPRLGFEKQAVSALQELCGDLEGRSAYLVEVGLISTEGVLSLLFVWVPD